MAKLSVVSDDFTLEFDAPDFAKIIGKAHSNIKTALYSAYEISGTEVEISLDFPQKPLPNPVILAKGVKGISQGEPFFFDNADYGVFVEMKSGCSDARVVHVSKLVENELSRHGNILYGTVNFGNEVGRYDFALAYDKTVNGVKTHESFVLTFEVLSQKLDYHQDWRTLVEEIEERYPMLAYDFLRRTYHTFGRASTEDDTSNLIWWNLFDRLQRPFVKACRLIMTHPKRRLRGVNEYRRADQLKRLTPSLENELVEFRTNPSHLYLVEKETDTHDTLENRFVKYALRSIREKYGRLHKALLKRDAAKKTPKLSDSAKVSMDDMESELNQLAANPFWRGVGRYTGMRQLSMTLQRAPGYSTIYRTLSILNAAYMIHAGMNRMETKDIAELYEIWCFLKVEEFTEAALPAAARMPQPDPVHGDDFVKILSTGLRSTVVFRSTTGVELARVVYNPEIKDSAQKNRGTGIEGTITPTSLSKKASQDPDIVLRLTNEDVGGYQVTYLFDAKYRMEDLHGFSVGAPPQDALDQMHRYRDAIYYAQDENSLEPFAYKKEIVGGYILFPGKGKVDLTPPSAGQPDNRPPYVKSIDRVNIGAIPLRPNDPYNANLLKDFIVKLVNANNNLDDVLGHVNPHKGALIPVATARAITEATVYGTYRGKPQLKWIRQRRFYNLPADSAKTVGITPGNAKDRKLLALLPPGRNPTEELLVFKIKQFCGVVSKADLKDPTKPTVQKPYAYPNALECHHDQYFVWELTDEDPITKRLANVRVVSGGQTGVDQGAFEAAVSLGLDIGGWAPHGWVAENGSIPIVFQSKMTEYPDQGSNAQNYRERTKANVRDSHATLILVDKLPLDGGTKLTNDFAASIGRSHHVVNMSAANAKEDALKWLRQFMGLSSALILNVAGPRESKSPGIQAKAKSFLSEVFWEV